MNFLNPLFLIGLAAAAIPIALHLLNLRKLKTVEFSTLRFLKELQKTKIRRLKLKQIILLILRTLIIIFAVLAFARPTIEGNLPFVESYARSSSVIIIDNSFSMDVSDEYGNRLNQTRNAALRILSSMKDGDEVAVIEAASQPNTAQFSLSSNFDYLKEQISNIKISNRRADLESALRRSAMILSESKNLNREIFVLSDFQSNVLISELKDTAGLFREKVSIFSIPVGSTSRTDIQNLSVDSLNLITRIFQTGKPVELDAQIRNNSKRDANSIVVSLLLNDERVSQRTIDIPAGEMRQLSLSAPPKSAGVTVGKIEIEGDALDSDNKRHFGFIVPEKPTIAIVGSQSSISFLSLALKAAGGNEPIANIASVSNNEFAGLDLSNFDMIIISGSLSKIDNQRIAEYAQTGGSILLFADENVSVQALSENLASLGFAGATAQSYPQNQAARFTSVDKHHPLFDGVFKGVTDKKEIIESPNIYKAAPANGGQAIIEMPGGAFLSEVKYGEGKIIYCAVPPNTSWSNFPMTGLFPALILRSALYLSSSESSGIYIEPGNPIVVGLPKRFSTESNLKLIDPTGNESFHQPVKLPSGVVLTFEGLNQLGTYKLQTTNGKPITIISINPSPSESSLTPVSQDNLSNWLETRFPNVNLEYIPVTDDLTKGITRARTGAELWQLFLILAILSAIAEMLVERSGKTESE